MKVEILSDTEFESLPYPETETSFGIADPEKNTAYVRYNPNKDIMSYLVNHEIEHLIEREGGVHSDHYRNGVYYKGLFDIFTGGGERGGGITNTIGRALVASRPSVQSAPPKPNVVGLGGNAPDIGGGDQGGGISPDTISRLKGFFSGRNPQGGF